MLCWPAFSEEVDLEKQSTTVKRSNNCKTIKIQLQNGKTDQSDIIFTLLQARI